MGYELRVPESLLTKLSVTTAALALAVSAGTPALAQSPPTPPGGPQAGESARIGASEDPTTASLLMSAASFVDDSAFLVVLGRNDVFADNLAGAALAAADEGETGGPMLLIPPAPAGLPQAVADELGRVLDNAGTTCGADSAYVYLLGGVDAVSPQVEQQLTDLGYCVERLAGASRVETSVAVANEILELRLGRDGATVADRGRILLARDDDPADAAAAGAYAARTGVPIVVTPGDELAPAVRDLLQPGDGAFRDVGLLGGAAALAPAVETAVLEAVDGQGFDTRIYRIQGPTRVETAIDVAENLWDPGMVINAAIVNGYGDEFWIYAIPGGAAAARASAPLLFVGEDEVYAPTDAYLRQNALGSLLTIGPESRISASTQEAAESALGSAVQPGTP